MIVDYQFLNSLSGDDSNDGHSWGRVVQTLAHIISLMNPPTVGLTWDMSVFMNENQLTEGTAAIPSGKSLSIQGVSNPPATIASAITGDASTDPIFSLSTGSNLKLANVLAAPAFAGKSTLLIDPGAGQGITLGLKDVGCVISTTTQRIIELGSVGLVGFDFDRVFFLPSGSPPWTGSKYFYSGNMTNMIGMGLVRNCSIVYIKAGTGIGLEETDILEIADGAHPGFRFYNCIWVEYDPVGGTYTVDTTPSAHPSTTSVEYRDPKPIQAFQDWKLLQPAPEELATEVELDRVYRSLLDAIGVARIGVIGR